MAQEWYYSIDNTPIGPITLEEIRQRVIEGTLLPSHLVWRSGMEQWEEAKSTELFSSPSIPPPLPKTPPPISTLVTEAQPEIANHQIASQDKADFYRHSVEGAKVHVEKGRQHLIDRASNLPIYNSCFFFLLLDSESARREFDKALSLDPSNTYYLCLRALTYSDPHDTLADALQAIKHDPTSAFARTLFAIALVQLDWEATVEPFAHLEYVLMQSPDHAFALYISALLQLRLPDGLYYAVDRLEASLDRQSTQSDTYGFLAIEGMLAGDFSPMVPEKCREIISELKQIRECLNDGVECLDKGESHNAITLLTRGIEILDSDIATQYGGFNAISLYDFRAKALQHIGEVESARRDWETALTACQQCLREFNSLVYFPDDHSFNTHGPLIHLWCGLMTDSAELNTSLERYDLAVGICNRVIERFPSHGPAYKQRALATLYLQRFHESFNDFQECLRLTPGDQEARAGAETANYLLGQLNCNQQQDQEHEQPGSPYRYVRDTVSQDERVYFECSWCGMTQFTKKSSLSTPNNCAGCGRRTSEGNRLNERSTENPIDKNTFQHGGLGGFLKGLIMGSTVQASERESLQHLADKYEAYGNYFMMRGESQTAMVYQMKRQEVLKTLRQKYG